MSQATTHPGSCSCGGEFELKQSGTQSRLLSDDVREYRLFTCPECGKAKRYERSDGDWERATH